MDGQQSIQIIHVIHRLNVGGLENGLVNLINHLPADKYQHAIICLTESSDFKRRIHRNDVDVYELHKCDGKDIRIYWRLWILLRRLRPLIVHTRNLSALESGVVAAFAGVPIRIHGEHGRDIYDLYGNNTKYKRLRRLCAPFIDQFIALSRDLEFWLKNEVGISPYKIVQLYNGVDTQRFHPRSNRTHDPKQFPSGFLSSDSIIIGTVGRLEPVKDQMTLLQAFLQLRKSAPMHSERCRLVILGDGPLHSKIEQLLAQIDEQTRNYVWLAGSRDDVPDILRNFDIFVLPSLGEGISNTILEAMASGLPVVATRVGGNQELVQEGVTGCLVSAADPDEMANALLTYLDDPELGQKQGQAGRKRAEELYSLNTMMQSYQTVYDDLLRAKDIKK